MFLCAFSSFSAIVGNLLFQLRFLESCRQSVVIFRIFIANLLYCRDERYTYIHLAPVSGANGYMQQKKKTKQNSTISYKQLARELTRNRRGSKCYWTKQSKISSNINQLKIDLVINGICRTLHQTSEYGSRPFLRRVRALDHSPDVPGISKNASGPVGIRLKRSASGPRG